ncbi:MAG: PIG-L family deacetylase [Alphaproteobacteria bacterium]|nr:PIG-L family deacetylase [Alphaproteobacteria bacterium]
MPQNPTDVSSAKIVSAYEEILKKPLPEPEIPSKELTDEVPRREEKCSCAVMLSPHPDDECLNGALPLRMSREKNWQIINVAITLGSDRSRRNERKKELAKACTVLGWDCMLADENGMEDVTLAGRLETEAWQSKVDRIAGILMALRPEAVILPHGGDWHVTHVGTHYLGMEALAKMPEGYGCTLIKTEYWQPMFEPNLLVGLSGEDAATLISGLACHVGEIERNAYDRRFPAYLIDTVRRGERVFGKGKKAPDMTFAELYEIGTWSKGKYSPSALNRVIEIRSSVEALFE